jgi:hypothetical protein
MGMVLEFIQPILEILKTVLIGNIVNKNGRDRSFVIGSGDGLERLLACGIPNL